MVCNCEIKKRNFEEVKTVAKEALAALGKKNFALIAHGNSFPAINDADTGFGTPNSVAGRNLIDFAGGVFNAIQLGPQGKTKPVDSSPYTGTIFSNNPLFIDLEELTTSEWGKILSTSTYKKVCDYNPNKNTGKTAYSYIINVQNEALKEAYTNFINSDDKSLKNYKKQFEKYKDENSFWLEKDSLYEALTIEYNNDYWPMWTSELDKNLFNPQNKDEEKASKERIKELKSKYEHEINFYSFCQYVISVQNEKTKNYAKSKKIKMIADRQVAFSDRDNWAYQSLFLKGWMLGCPPDYFSKDGQAWGFPVLDPEKLFDEKDHLGEAGKLMKRLYTKMFSENPGGVRIDHIVGLIDPWVYKAGKTPKPEDGAGRLYSSPEHPELCKYAIAQYEDLDLSLEPDKEKRVKTLNKDQIKKYGRLIEKVVIDAAKEVGLNKDSIVCEDLGTLTNPVAAVMKLYDLQGMRVTQFVVPEKPEHPYRCSNIVERAWAMVGTHDNEPIAMWADKLVYTHESYLHAKNLVDDLWTNANGAAKDALIVRLTQDAKFLTQTKLVEMFASKAENIQIFFTDFFGIKDVYNRPGTSGDENWSLRIPNNFTEYYCKSLEEGNGLNLPLVLKLAIEARGSEFAQKHANLIKKLENLI